MAGGILSIAAARVLAHTAFAKLGLCHARKRNADIQQRSWRGGNATAFALLPKSVLSREMRLVDITMIGVGAMIGAGIFVLTGIAAGVAGPALILVFLLNGIVTCFAAAAYAELGSSFHSAGGGYLYVKTGLKDPQGFMSGWMSWFAYVVACALYALGFGAYLKECLPLIGLGGLTLPFFPVEKWMAVAVVAVFCFINYRGASEAGGAGNLVTGGKIVLLAVFIGFGVWITAASAGLASDLHRKPVAQRHWQPVHGDGTDVHRV